MELLGDKLSGNILNDLMEEEFASVLKEKREKKEDEEADIIEVAEEVDDDDAEVASANANNNDNNASDEEEEDTLPPENSGFPSLTGQKSINSLDDDQDSDEDDLYDFDGDGTGGAAMLNNIQAATPPSGAGGEMVVRPDPNWKGIKENYIEEVFKHVNVEKLWSYICGEKQSKGGKELVEVGGGGDDSFELSVSEEESSR